MSYNPFWKEFTGACISEDMFILVPELREGAESYEMVKKAMHMRTSQITEEMCDNASPWHYGTGSRYWDWSMAGESSSVDKWELAPGWSVYCDDEFDRAGLEIDIRIAKPEEYTRLQSMYAFLPSFPALLEYLVVPLVSSRKIEIKELVMALEDLMYPAYKNKTKYQRAQGWYDSDSDWDDGGYDSDKEGTTSAAEWDWFTELHVKVLVSRAVESVVAAQQVEAAHKISFAWIEAHDNPAYALCRRRLLREFHELTA